MAMWGINISYYKKQNVDNVDNLVDSYIYGKPVSTKNDQKYKDFQEFVEWCRNVLCKSVFHEKIHMFMQHIMLINMWIMWITLSLK